MASVVAVAPVAAEAPGWVLYTHPEKLMSVRFPGKPTEMDQETPTQIGKIKFKLAMFTSSDRTYFTTAVVYPIKSEFDVQRALDGARDQALGNIGGKIKTEKPAKLDGMAGREVAFEAPNGQQTIRGVMRLFASDKPPSLFMASAMRATDKPDPDTVKFLDSMRLGKHAERAPSAK